VPVCSAPAAGGAHLLQGGDTHAQLLCRLSQGHVEVALHQGAEQALSMPRHTAEGAQLAHRQLKQEVARPLRPP
jgi:hypothetical protein